MALIQRFLSSSYGFLIFWAWTQIACTYTEKIRDGKTAFERKQYAVAIPMLEKDYNKTKDNQIKGEKAYLLAESYRLTGRPNEAGQWYERALGHRVGKDAALKQARMLQMQEDYDQAYKAYQRAGRDRGDVQAYRLQMQACVKAKTWLAERKDNPYRLENLPFNNEATDFAPIFWENRLVFASDRAASQGKEKYKWTNEKFFDFFETDAEGKEAVKPWALPFNGAYHQGTVSFTADGSRAYFTACGSDQQEEPDFCLIYEVKRQGSAWSQPKALPFTRNMASNFMHPQVRADGKQLIFAANLKAGFGGYDLYRSLYIEQEDRWSEPKNLGSLINTAGHEVFPFWQGDTLYFASDGHPGMGGLDIFRVEQDGDRWRKLENLAAPINSGGDDFGLVVRLDFAGDSVVLQRGYLSSNRLGGKGSDDVYAWERRILRDSQPPLDTPRVVQDSPLVKGPSLRIRLEGLTLEPQYRDARNPALGLDSLLALANVSIQVFNADTAFVLGSDEDGRFSLDLVAGQVYTFRASKPSFFNAEAELSTEGIVLPERGDLDTVLRLSLRLDRILLNQEIVLENIYYDYNKCDIRSDARPTLDTLSYLLKKNPDIKIQLSAHTDCRGTNAYNQKLSQCRAESAVAYLVREGGIEAGRLRAKGFGEEQPAVACVCERCSEEEHQRNRRTTFMVLE